VSLIARRYPFGEVKYQGRMVDCYGFHMHDVLVISARLGSGELRFDFEDEQVEVGENTLVCFPPRQLHRAVIEKEVEGYGILHIDPKWLRDALGLNLDAVVLKRQVNDGGLYRRFQELVLSDTLEESIYLEEVTEWLIAFFDEVLVEGRALPIPDQTLEAVRTYLEAHWDEAVEIPHIAEHFGLNLYTMIRQFKHHYGSTPKKYLLDHRVHHAKRLLTEGMPIVEAALTCGFYDQSHLYNYFKKIFGVSPKVYQEAFRAK
jgi:AraC-like DNA-binding protein